MTVIVSRVLYLVRFAELFLLLHCVFLVTFMNTPGVFGNRLEAKVEICRNLLELSKEAEDAGLIRFRDSAENAAAAILDNITKALSRNRQPNIRGVYRRGPSRYCI